MTAGYSGKPLVKKLGLKGNARAVVVGAPSNYAKLLGPLPDEVSFAGRARGRFDFIHVFCKTRDELVNRLGDLKRRMLPDSMLWVSWPKKTSPLAGELNENVVREVGLGLGLVDIKVCAIDSDWSGLKFVIPKKDRE